MNLTLIILAAGLSTRYGRPKQLEPVGPSGEALLDYGIYDALRAGFDKIVLVTRPELKGALTAHVERVFGDSVEVAYAYQESDRLPNGCRPPERRVKPWGTGHAVLAAEAAVAEPFVVINADDFYGAEAYTSLAGHLRAAELNALEFAAAGYTLRDTLSPHGGVSRAVCEVDRSGYLERVTEVKKIEDVDGTLVGVTVEGDSYVLRGDETISMNIWAATPRAFPILHDQFAIFLATHGQDIDSEFLLSTAVNDQIAAGRTRVKVIPTPGPWLGVTYPEDRPFVEERLGELIAAGGYPGDIAAVMAAGD